MSAALSLPFFDLWGLLTPIATMLKGGPDYSLLDDAMNETARVLEGHAERLERCNATGRVVMPRAELEELIPIMARGIAGISTLMDQFDSVRGHVKAATSARLDAATKRDVAAMTTWRELARVALMVAMYDEGDITVDVAAQALGMPPAEFATVASEYLAEEDDAEEDRLDAEEAEKALAEHLASGLPGIPIADIKREFGL